MEEREENHEKRLDHKGLTSLTTTDKISFVTLSVQQNRMKIEAKQTKNLSLSTQELGLKSQIECARQLAMVACPTFNPENMYWKNVTNLMEKQTLIMQNMASMSEEILVHSDDDIMQETDIIDIHSSSVKSPSPVKNPEKSPTKTSKPDETTINSVVTHSSKRNDITIRTVDVHNAIDVSSECSSTQSTSTSTKKTV